MSGKRSHFNICEDIIYCFDTLLGLFCFITLLSRQKSITECGGVQQEIARSNRIFHYLSQMHVFVLFLICSTNDQKYQNHSL